MILYQHCGLGKGQFHLVCRTVDPAVVYRIPIGVLINQLGQGLVGGDHVAGIDQKGAGVKFGGLFGKRGGFQKGVRELGIEGIAPQPGLQTEPVRCYAHICHIAKGLCQRRRYLAQIPHGITIGKLGRQIVCQLFLRGLDKGVVVSTVKLLFGEHDNAKGAKGNCEQTTGSQ